jgi:hypothetical protein
VSAPRAAAPIVEDRDRGSEHRRRAGPSGRSFWAGRLILVIIAAIVAEYGYVRHAWVIGSLGAIVAVAALAYAWYTRLRSRG